MNECECPHPDLCTHPSHDLLRFRNDKVTLERVLDSIESDYEKLRQIEKIVEAMP